MSKSKFITIAGVSERDIDLLLLEEFIASTRFCEWFISKIAFSEAKGANIEDVKRSVTHSTGESDLEITLINPEKNRYRLLIENKVNAGFQPEQAERYKQRGETYIQHDDIQQYKTILVAPQAYFPNELKGFDARVNYEVLCEWFEHHSLLGERTRYKLSLLQSAIEKGTTGYQMIADAPVTNFWTAYWTLLQEIAPELDMEEPGNKPAGSTFIYFRGFDLPKGVSLCHKLTHGYIDVQFARMGERVSELKTQYSPYLTDKMKMTQAGKSAVIRLHVPQLSIAETFESQQENVIQGIEAAKQLLKWYQETSLSL